MEQMRHLGTSMMKTGEFREGTINLEISRAANKGYY